MKKTKDQEVKDFLIKAGISQPLTNFLAYQIKDWNSLYIKLIILLYDIHIHEFSLNIQEDDSSTTHLIERAYIQLFIKLLNAKTEKEIYCHTWETYLFLMRYKDQYSYYRTFLKYILDKSVSLEQYADFLGPLTPMAQSLIIEQCSRPDIQSLIGK